jgi:hypothetical protein
VAEHERAKSRKEGMRLLFAAMIASKGATARLGASDKMRLRLAAMVAISATLGALTAWQAGKTSIHADEADRAGFRQKIAEVDLRARVLREHDASIYSYLEWKSRRAYATALGGGTQTEDTADAARLQVETQAELAVAANAWNEIPSSARSGTPGRIDLDRADREAAARIQKDENIEATPGEEFARADRLRNKRERLVLCAAFMLVAAVAFTLGQVRRRRDWRIWVRVGFVLLAAAALLATWSLLV